MKSLGLFFSFVSSSLQRRNLKVVGVLLAVFVVLVTLFSVMFHWLMAREGQSHSWATSVYWTLVTMTTLGFGDITFQSDAGRIFSVIVLMSGTLFLLILLPFTFIQFVVAPWIAAREAARAPRQLPPDTSGHLLLTKYGPVEEALIRRASHSGVGYAVIVPEADDALALHDRGVDVMVGDLDDPDTYRAARVGQAAVVAATASDVVNTNTTFTVREVSATVPIMATVSSPASIDILQLAGADVVLQLGEMLGQAMAERALAPIGRSHQVGQYAGLLIAEVAAAGTPLAGRTLADLGLRARLGLGIIGIWERGNFEVATADLTVSPTGIVLLAGTAEQLAAFDAEIAVAGPDDGGFVIIGGGRVGRAAGHAFDAAGSEFRIVEQQAGRIRDPAVYVQGDAAELAVLEAAGIRDASAVVITTHDDDVNIYLAMYCRRLRPELRVIARANVDRNVSTLYRAGADAVLSYASMGAGAIWNRVSDDDAYVIAEGLHVFRRPVPPGLVGQTLASSHLHRRTGCNVVAISHGDRMQANPPADLSMTAADSLIMIGDVDAENRFTAEFPPEHR
ncbi:MAG: potassium channel family protein [Desertimonas sp.]